MDTLGNGENYSFGEVIRLSNIHLSRFYCKNSWVHINQQKKSTWRNLLSSISLGISSAMSRTWYLSSMSKVYSYSRKRKNWSVKWGIDTLTYYDCTPFSSCCFQQGVQIIRCIWSICQPSRPNNVKKHLEQELNEGNEYISWL